MDFKNIEKEIKSKLKPNNIWIPIFQDNYDTEKSRSTWFMTFCEDKESCFNTVCWNCHLETYYGKSKGDIGETKYFLVIKRSGNKFLKEIEIAEDFRLFYNLYKQNNEYYISEYNSEPEKVIRYSKENKLYEINYKYLIEYISYKKIHAVLNFELDFYHNNKTEKDKIIKTKNAFFDKRNYSHNSLLYRDKFSCMTRYMGKLVLDSIDIEKINSNTVTKFIIGKTNGGNFKYVHLKDWSTSKECDVCFDRKVLGKYYENPETYHVAYSNVSCENYWSLNGFNQESFREIIVSTHNLLNLPYKEREHWSKFAKIREDTSCNTKEIHITSTLISNLENFKYYLKKQNKEQLFKELSEDNQYKQNQIYVPLNTEISEFFKIIENICVCFIDAIDNKILRKNTNEEYISKDLNGDICKGTRIALKDFFKSHNVYVDDFDEFLKYLIAIRDNSAHTKSSNYKNAKDYFKLDTIGTQQCIINIAKKLNEILCCLAKCFNIIL